MTRDFDGQTVLVTGAASGIGFEMARQFYEAGSSSYPTSEATAY
jgi:NAD(P)-dependent dehydrogenase (short-subunit alcohol dehydrogenase family)